MEITAHADKVVEIKRLELLAQEIGDKAAKRNEEEDGFYTNLMVEALDKAEAIRQTL